MKWLLFLTAFVPLAAQAQSIDQALSLYKNREYPEAAVSLFDVLQHDADPEIRDKAEIYLAEALARMQLYMPALFYYSDVLKAGSNNRYYLNAVEGLLGIQQELHDPIFVPKLINESLDPQGFGHLAPERIAHVNYLIGELSFRKQKNEDARAFLEYVRPESIFYPNAVYLLGLLEVRLGNLKAAREKFDLLIDLVPPNHRNPELIRLRGLSILAAARTAYTMGAYPDGIHYLDDIPRFSHYWFQSLYERAWAHYKAEEYGKALGALESITSPFFSKFHVPEAYVIQGTTYFVSCHWDRVRGSVQEYNKVYQPMLKEIGTYLGAEREPQEYYRDVVNEAAGLPLELLRDVRRTKRFLDYHYMLEHMKWERDEIANVPVWRDSRLAQDVTSILDEQRSELEPVVGTWVQAQLENRRRSLQHFQNQVNILDFEVADAERKWLEQGKEILKGRRARLPRPEIQNDQWQHWSFRGEYWRDELGFLQHSLRSECF